MLSRLKFTAFNLMLIGILHGCTVIVKDESDNKDADSSDVGVIIGEKVESNLKIGGTYSFGTSAQKGETGSVLIYPITDSAAAFCLNVCSGAPSYNLGQLVGFINVNNGVGYYTSNNSNDEMDCYLRFDFKGTKLVVFTDKEHCDCLFGHAVHADHTYSLVDSSVPAYYISYEGDTVLFKDFVFGDFDF